MMFTKAKLWAAAAAAFVLGLLGIYLKGREDGERQAGRRRIDAMKTAKDVRDEIQDDPYFVDRARQWVRKDKR